MTVAGAPAAPARGEPAPGGPAHPRVPARGVRRRGRARHLPGPGPGGPGRPDRPLRGRRPARGRGAPAVGPARRGEPGAGHDLHRPVDDGRGGRRGPGALAHLVRQPRRAPGLDAVRGTARGHRALAGATAAVEGGAARRWVRPVQLVRAGGGRGRRRGDRGVRGDAGGRAGRLPRGAAGPGPGHPERDRRRGVRPGRRDRGAAPVRGGPVPARGDLRRADHPAERGPGAAPGGRQPAARGAAGAVRGPAGHPRAGRGGQRAGDQPAGRTDRGDLDPGDAAASPRSSSC